MYLIDINKEIEFKAWDYMIITMSLKLLLLKYKVYKISISDFTLCLNNPFI